MSSRDDHENKFDSLRGRQLHFDLDAVPSEDVDEGWINRVLQTPMRILKNNIIQRHLAPLARTRKKWVENLGLHGTRVIL